MYMARIPGYYDVIAFAEDAEKAKRTAIRNKRDRWFGPHDDFKWKWDDMEEYFGGYCIEIKNGLVDIS